MLSRRPGARFNRGRIAVASGGGAPAPPADTPLTVYAGDLKQWLRGDLGITLGTGVSAWADQSGGGMNAIQATGTAQPAYSANDATLDNQATVTADGSNDVLTTAGLTTDLATDDFYVCAIIKPITWTNGDSWTSGNGTTPPRSFQAGSTPSTNMTAAVSVNLNSASVLGSWFRYEALWTTTAGVSYLKIGGTNVQTGNPGTGARTSSSLFGAPSALFGNFALAEFFAVRRAAGSGGPTVSERAAIDSYLAGRYPSAGL